MYEKLVFPFPQENNAVVAVYCRPLSVKKCDSCGKCLEESWNG